MSKADAGIFLAHGLTLSEFLGHLGSEFDYPYFLILFSLKSILCSHLNHSNRIRNEEVMAKLQKLVETGNRVEVVPVEPQVLPVELGQK